MLDIGGVRVGGCGLWPADRHEAVHSPGRHPLGCGPIKNGQRESLGIDLGGVGHRNYFFDNLRFDDHGLVQSFLVGGLACDDGDLTGIEREVVITSIHEPDPGKDKDNNSSQADADRGKNRPGRPLAPMSPHIGQIALDIVETVGEKRGCAGFRHGRLASLSFSSCDRSLEATSHQHCVVAHRSFRMADRVHPLIITSQ